MVSKFAYCALKSPTNITILLHKIHQSTLFVLTKVLLTTLSWMDVDSLAGDGSFIIDPFKWAKQITQKHFTRFLNQTLVIKAEMVRKTH